MEKEVGAPVRAFPTWLVALAGWAMVVAFAILGWTAYDGFRQSRVTGEIVRSAQSLEVELIDRQQSLLSMLIMRSATGDIRWSHRYTQVTDDLYALRDNARSVSDDFAGAVDRFVRAGIAVAQFEAEVVDLLSQNRVADAREAVLGPEFEAQRDAYQESLQNLGREIELLSVTAQARFERRFQWSAAGAVAVLLLSIVVSIISVRRLREWRLALDRNIDELKSYETELEDRVAERTRAFEEAERRLRAAVDNMSGGIVMVDRDFNLQLFNDRFVELYDLPDGLAQVGEPLARVFQHRAERGEYGKGDIDTLVAERIRSYRENPNARIEDHVISADRAIELYRSEIDDGGLVAVFNDVTERKRATELLEDANLVMRDSIQYASRIQRALLPGDDALGEMFADHFCIWEPRDVVGGDMYWVRHDRRGYFVVLFDCTGHGVPGALMTTIAVSALNVAFTETGDPSRLITRVNQIVKHALGQEEETGLSDDGLEMGVCLVEPERMRVTYAGARFDLLSGVGGEIEHFRGDRSSLGYRHVPFDARFTNHSIRLSPGQRLYMYTDGILDQIGGNRRRAFGRKRLASLLQETAHLPMPEQGTAVSGAFADYQGGEARRDDVALIGFMPLH